MSSTRSNKAKGRRLQNQVRDSLLEYFKDLEPDDIRSTTMGMSGEDIQLSTAARKVLPFSFECKNQEKLSIWSALNQAEANCPEGDIPTLVFKRNHSETYVTLKFDDFLKLLKEE